MSYLKVLFVIPLAATLPIIGCSHTETTPTTQTVTVTASPSPQPDLFEGSALDGYTYKLCDSQAAQATPVTSCEFAVAVAQAFRYLGNRGGNVHAHSPVTQQWYDMYCVTGYTARTKSGLDVPATRCTGGNNAVVVILDN